MPETIEATPPPMSAAPAMTAPPTKANPAAAPPAATPAIVEAADLLRGTPEVAIRHAGQTYRLRVTRANKLILTK